MEDLLSRSLPAAPPGTRPGRASGCRRVRRAARRNGAAVRGADFSSAPRASAAGVPEPAWRAIAVGGTPRPPCGASSQRPPTPPVAGSPAWPIQAAVPSCSEARRLRAEFDADRCRAGLELVERRSGGGAVVVFPGAQVWLDLFVPVSDQLFDTDVVRASSFVGAPWRD